MTVSSDTGDEAGEVVIARGSHAQAVEVGDDLDGQVRVDLDGPPSVAVPRAVTVEFSDEVAADGGAETLTRQQLRGSWLSEDLSRWLAGMGTFGLVVAGYLATSDPLPAFVVIVASALAAYVGARTLWSGA